MPEHDRLRAARRPHPLRQLPQQGDLGL